MPSVRLDQPARQLAAASMAVLMLTLAGCDQSEPPPPVEPAGPAERAGKQIDDAIQEGSVRAQSAIDKAREGLANAANEAANRLEAAGEALESKPPTDSASH